MYSKAQIQQLNRIGGEEYLKKRIRRFLSYLLKFLENELIFPDLKSDALDTFEQFVCSDDLNSYPLWTLLIKRLDPGSPSGLPIFVQEFRLYDAAGREYALILTWDAERNLPLKMLFAEKILADASQPFLDFSFHIADEDVSNFELDFLRIPKPIRLGDRYVYIYYKDSWAEGTQY